MALAVAAQDEAEAFKIYNEEPSTLEWVCQSTSSFGIGVGIDIGASPTPTPAPVSSSLPTPALWTRTSDTILGTTPQGECGALHSGNNLSISDEQSLSRCPYTAMSA